MSSKVKTVKRIIILGATGSVGTDTLEVIRQNAQDFEIVGLSCNTNSEELAALVREFNVPAVCVGNNETKIEIQKVLPDLTTFEGRVGLFQLIENQEFDLLVNCLVGEVGIEVTKQTASRGINIALANKEVLVAAGEELLEIADHTGAHILPIDSEICAIYQCLHRMSKEDIARDVEKIVLTCSGGPFRGKSREELEDATLEEALVHPTWPNMGKKITVDSATLMNKGYEVIEAAHLFGLDPEQIEVVIHPQSLVHGIVYFKDGNMLMHASTRDMKISIHYCLYYPETVENHFPRLDLTDIGKLEFYKPDTTTFTNLSAAYNALREKTTKELVQQNDANVAQFLEGEISFLEVFV